MRPPSIYNGKYHVKRTYTEIRVIFFLFSQPREEKHKILYSQEEIPRYTRNFPMVDRYDNMFKITSLENKLYINYGFFNLTTWKLDKFINLKID